jgi:DNA-binding MarR family transcriptional regulator
MSPKLDPQNSACCLMSQLTHTIEQEISSSLADMNLTVLQLEVLAELSMDASLSTADLARLTFVTPQNMSLAISRLADRGYLLRSAHPTNARINRLHLTPRGRRTLDRAIRRAKRVETRTFAALKPRERAMLLAALRKCLWRFGKRQPNRAMHSR